MSKLITAEELRKHTSSESHWLAIDGNVYDVTAFLNEVSLVMFGLFSGGPFGVGDNMYIYY